MYNLELDGFLKFFSRNIELGSLHTKDIISIDYKLKMARWLFVERKYRGGSADQCSVVLKQTAMNVLQKYLYLLFQNIFKLRSTVSLLGKFHLAHKKKFISSSWHYT